MLDEISQIEKDKYCMISLTCGIQKNKQVNITKRNRLTDNKLAFIIEWMGEKKNRGMGLRGTNYCI